MKLTRQQTRPEAIPDMDLDDWERIRNVLVSAAANGNVSWGAQAHLDVWLAEQRMESDRKASARIERATWALALVTLALVVATVALVIVTVGLE